MLHITLHTPRAEKLSAGIVCFSIGEMNPYAAVRRLRERRVIASVTPYAARYMRLAPNIRNSSAEVDAVLREIRALSSQEFQALRERKARCTCAVKPGK